MMAENSDNKCSANKCCFMLYDKCNDILKKRVPTSRIVETNFKFIFLCEKLVLCNEISIYMEYIFHLNFKLFFAICVNIFYTPD